MVVKHLNLGGGEEWQGSQWVKPIEQLKHGCFALLARHNKPACGRHVYSPSSASQAVWELREGARQKGGTTGGGKMTIKLCAAK